MHNLEDTMQPPQCHGLVFIMIQKKKASYTITHPIRLGETSVEEENYKAQEEKA